MSTQPEQYLISGQARKELDEIKHDLYRRVKFHILTAQQAADAFEAAVRKIIHHARRPIDPDSYVRIACKFCHREYSVKLDVREFECHCAPNETQSAFIQRLALV